MALRQQNLQSASQGYLDMFQNVSASSENSYQMLEPDRLDEIKNQPFKLLPPEKLEQLANDIELNDQQHACIVRKMPDETLVILSGRNRKRACEMKGLKVKCEVIECDDIKANLILCNTNLLQRELSHSDKARGYKMQQDNLKALGEKRTTSAIAEMYGTTDKTVNRYINLARLGDGLLEMVDEERIQVSAGFEISYFIYEDSFQKLYDFLKVHPQISIKKAQGKQLRELESEHQLYSDVLSAFFFPSKDQKKVVKPISLKADDLSALPYDFKGMKQEDIREFVLECLDNYFSGKTYHEK